MMCDLSGECGRPAPAPEEGPRSGEVPRGGLSRRGLVGAGAGLASAASLGSLWAAAPAQATASTGSRKPRSGMRAILVGTAGGPIWRQAGGRRGICTVIEVDGARYLVDAGHGAASGLWGAGAMGAVDGRNDLSAYRAGFLTHLHSDHVTDLATFMVQGFIGGGLGVGSPFTIFGPGDRGRLPQAFPPGRTVEAPFNPANPTPGTVAMVGSLMEAFGTDINDRIFDAASPKIDDVIRAVDIALPAGVTPGFDGTPPPMAPFSVYEDDRVRVTAVLVAHGQVVPAYAFRFESDRGAIVISGDTTLTPNLLELADGADLLLHEVIDYDSVNASIEALAVPAQVKDAFRNHMFGAHTTEAQLRELVRQIRVRTLALHHVVPGDIGEKAWHRVAQRIGRGTRTEVVAGVDDLVLGV